VSERVVITGANSGIGYAAARQLAERGYGVVLAVRDTDRGAAAADRLREVAPRADVHVMRLDLADLGSVRRFAADYRERHPGPDVLVNNAGVMALPRRVSADGHELQFATNHLGHFALTGLLLDGILDRPAPRVVTVASLMHRIGRIRFDDLDGERRYSKWLAYSNTKLANLLFAFELQRRSDMAGCGLRSLAVHPGYSSTGLVFAGPRMSGSRLKQQGYAALNRLVGQSADDGARPTVRAATADVPGGSYVGPDGRFELRGAPTLVRATRRARDATTACRLWEVSEQLTAVDFDFGSAAAPTTTTTTTATTGA
jgi:NAD(P)-dependent dehydrogenase (short-subunit alcohol dehydrogenase family)